MVGITSVARTISRNHVLSGTSVSSSPSVRSSHSSASKRGRELLAGSMFEPPTDPAPSVRRAAEQPLSVVEMSEGSAQDPTQVPMAQAHLAPVSPADAPAGASIEPAIVIKGIHHRCSERRTTAMTNLGREVPKEPQTLS